MNRRKLMTWILAVIGVIVVLVAAVVIIGMSLPKEHVATRTLKLNQSSEAVWQVISDFRNQPSWLPLVKSSERMPDHNGREVWQEVYNGMGDDKVTLETTDSTPPQKLVRTIPDTGGPFSGRWEYEITPTSDGCSIKITELGVVPNPVFRFMGRFVFGESTTIENYLKALAAKFGQPANIS